MNNSEEFPKNSYKSNDEFIAKVSSELSSFENENSTFDAGFGIIFSSGGGSRLRTMPA